jgi:hypothetical protein
MDSMEEKRESTLVDARQPRVLASQRDENPTPRREAAGAIQRAVGAPLAAIGPTDILTLQRAAGNRAVQRVLEQRLESESTVARASDFGARDANGVAADAEPAVERAGASSGHALPDDVRGRFEHSLEADLSGVRVHTGRESSEAATAVGAKAYTVGQDIHFGAGHYSPTEPAGVHLLAHEVAHTVQHQGADPARRNKLEGSNPSDATEREADRAADAMVARTAAETDRDEDGSRLGRVP